MGNHGRLAGLPWTQTVLSRHQKIGCCSSWSPSKPLPFQVVHGRLVGMGQGKANQWMHVLLPALLVALRALGDAPARSLTALAQRLGVSEADAATVVAPLEEEPAPLATVPAAAPASPRVPMTGPNGVSSAPQTPLNSR